MYLDEKKISHLITGIISAVLSLYVCIACLGLFINDFYWGDSVFFICAFGFFYLILFKRYSVKKAQICAIIHTLFFYAKENAN